MPKIIYPLAFLSLIYSFIGFRFVSFISPTPYVHDEGIITYGATMVLSGGVPYKDFWALYGPGQFYLIAGLFKLFGSYILVERIYLTIINSLVPLVVYLIAQRLILSRFALIPWFLTLLWLNTFGFGVMSPALLFSLLSTLFILYFLAEKQKKYLFLGGLMAGISLLFRHDIGLAVTIVEGTIVSLFVFFSLLPKKMPLLQKLIPILKFNAYYLFGWGIILLPVAIYLIRVVPPADLINDLVVYPFTIYPKVFLQRYPAILPNPAYIFSGVLTIIDYFKQVLLRIAYYFPLIIYISAIVIIAFQLRKGINTLAVKIWGFALFTLLGIMFLVQGLIRAHIDFLRPAFIPAFLLLAFSMDNLTFFSKRNFVRSILIFFILVMALIPFSEKVARITKNFSCPFYFEIERAKGIYSDDGAAVKNYQGLVKYIQKNVPENERMFVGNSRHDKVFYNDIMLYYLSNRQSATKYYTFNSGLTDTKRVQEAIVSDIEKYRVRYIILLEVDKFCLASRSSGIFFLDDFIRKNFAPAQNFEGYTAWKRK